MEQEAHSPRLGWSLDRLASRAGRRRVVLGALAGALAIATVLVLLSGLTDRPVGFHLDESAIAYNAVRIAEMGIDEYGQPWPLFFESFDDWKSPLCIYLLAVIFNVAGPSILAARALSALAGILTVALLAWLGYRVTRRGEVALMTGATTLLMPWTFEPTRLVFEIAVVMTLLASFLLVLRARPPTDSRTAMVILSIALAALTYSSVLGRVLGPLLAFGLIVYVRRDRWRGVVGTWAIYGMTLLPLVAFELSHPGSLGARLQEAGYLSRPLPEAAATFAHQVLGYLDPVRLLLLGDPNERHHVAGIMGSLLLATLLLGIIGVDRVVHRLRGDPWHRYLIYGLAASFIPAALTLDVFHGHRAIGVPVFLIALTFPAQAWLLGKGKGEPWRRGAFVVLTIATLVQGAYFQIRYDDLARHRGHWFDDAYPGLLDQALATRADPIYLEDGLVPGYIHAYWYGSLRGVPAERFVHLRPDSRAPSGAIVLSSKGDCAPCVVLATGGFFVVYRVP